jgi:glutamate-1-semialdehyde aminotransferase
MEPVLYDRVDVGAALQQARTLADEHGAVLIFDEIVSGFRIARGGASEKFGVTPDLACWAKGIANGMPLAAVTGRKQFHDLTATLVISTTYGGETLSLAAAKACLDIYAKQDVIGHATRLGERLLSGMQTAAHSVGLKMHFGGHPMMGGYLFGYQGPDMNRDLTTLFLKELARRGVLFRRNGLLFISFSHTIEQIEMTIRAAAEAMAIMADAVESGSIRELLLNPDEPAAEFRVR